MISSQGSTELRYQLRKFLNHTFPNSSHLQAASHSGSFDREIFYHPPDGSQGSRAGQLPSVPPEGNISQFD